MNTFLMKALFSALSFVLMACGGGSPMGRQPDAGSDAASDALDGGTGSVDAETFHCSLPTPCPIVDYIASDDEGNFPPLCPGYVSDVDAARCILQKLRDRVVSMHGYTIQTPTCYNVQDFSSEVLFILDDMHGAVSVVGSFISDDPSAIPYNYSGISGIGTLQPPSYFDGCLGATNIDKIMRCIISPFSDVSMQRPVCPK